MAVENYSRQSEIPVIIRPQIGLLKTRFFHQAIAFVGSFKSGGVRPLRWLRPGH
jgi:hypothetical protein